MSCSWSWQYPAAEQSLLEQPVWLILPSFHHITNHTPSSLRPLWQGQGRERDRGRGKGRIRGSARERWRWLEGEGVKPGMRNCPLLWPIRSGHSPLSLFVSVRESSLVFVLTPPPPRHCLPAWAPGRRRTHQTRCLIRRSLRCKIYKTREFFCRSRTTPPSPGPAAGCCSAHF